MRTYPCILLALLCSCTYFQEDEPENIVYRHLTADERALIPYKLNDTVLFENPDSDSIYYLTCISDFDERVVDGSETDYKLTIEEYDQRRLTMLLTGDQIPEYTKLSFRQSTRHSDLSGDFFITIYIDSERFQYNMSTQANSKEIRFNDFINNKEPIPKHNNLVVNNNTFQDVYYLTNTVKFIDTLYFTRHYGIVRISFRGDSLDLVWAGKQ